MLNLRKYNYIALIITQLLLVSTAKAEDVFPLQDPMQTQLVAERFLSEQLKNKYAKFNVKVTAPDARLRLIKCDSLDAFLPQGGKMIGRTTIGVKCTAPKLWSLFLSANSQVYGTYLIATAPLSAGKVLDSTDVGLIEGELSLVPQSVVTDINLVVGQVAATNISPGMPIKKEFLKSVPSVTQGQTIRVIVKGQGFQITAEGRALQTVGEGQVANVKLDNGQNLSGIARKGGIVEVSN